MKMNLKPDSNKHIPQRTCAACRQIKDKRQLIRLVRSADGGVVVDKEGKMPGRGAYLCSEVRCWQNGLTGHNLERMLRVKISSESRKRLIEFGKTLSGGC